MSEVLAKTNHANPDVPSIMNKHLATRLLATCTAGEIARLLLDKPSLLDDSKVTVKAILNAMHKQYPNLNRTSRLVNLGRLSQAFKNWTDDPAVVSEWLTQLKQG